MQNTLRKDWSTAVGVLRLLAGNAPAHACEMRPPSVDPITMQRLQPLTRALSR
jgi:hypothetical protein